MESKRHHHQPPIESTPPTSLEEVLGRSTQELQDSSSESPKPRGFEGRRHTLETKAKMSEAKKGDKNPNYGKELSPEHRAKISESKKTKNLSSETKAKMSEAKKGERHPRYDQSIDQVRLAIIDCVLGESQKQASHNQGFADSWLSGWKLKNRQRFDAFYLETATELDRMVTSGKIGSRALELAAGATHQELARKLANYLSVHSEPPLQPDSKN